MTVYNPILHTLSNVKRGEKKLKNGNKVMEIRDIFSGSFCIGLQEDAILLSDFFVIYCVHKCNHK